MRGLILMMFVGYALGHICMLSPPQRGPLSVSRPGDPTCYRRVGPCGNHAFDGTIAATYSAGETVQIEFQQNLNHWNFYGQPGFFDVSFMASPSATPVTLDKFDDYPAFDMVTQTNFSRSIQIPMTQTAHGLLVVRYVSYNQDEVDPANNTNAIFYNCADIAVVAASDEPMDEPVVSKSTVSHSESVSKGLPESNHLPLAAPAYECQVPPELNMTAIETTTANGDIFHNIVISQKLNMVYWLRRGNLQGLGDSTIVTLTNYTSLLEYVEWASESPPQCEVYGPDKRYPWAYGADHAMPNVQHINGPIWEFSNPTNGLSWRVFQFGNTRDCLPYSFQTQFSSYSFVDYHSDFDYSIFDVPTSCHTPRAIHHGCM